MASDQLLSVVLCGVLWPKLHQMCEAEGSGNDFTDSNRSFTLGAEAAVHATTRYLVVGKDS